MFSIGQGLLIQQTNKNIVIILMMVLFVFLFCFYFIDIFIYFICNIYVYGTKLWFFFICSFAVGRILNPIVYELTGAFA